MAAYNTGTWNNLYTQWRSFILFCLYYGHQYLPCSMDTILLYMQFLSRTFKSVTSIENYVSGVKMLHYFNNQAFPDLKNQFQYRLLIKGLNKINLHTVKQALPITPEILIQIFNIMDFNSESESVFWCLLLTAVLIFARIGNILPKSQKAINVNKHLLARDIITNEVGLIVFLKHSKTNQAAKKIVTIPISSKPGSPLDPLSAYNHMKSFQTHVSPATPAFSYKSKDKVVSFTTSKFTKVLRNKLNTLGYNEHLYSNHSVRRGGCSWSFRAGVPSELIKLQGQWSSSCYLRYLEFSTETKLSITQKMLNCI